MAVPLSLDRRNRMSSKNIYSEVECLICHKKFKTNKGLVSHLAAHNMRVQEYYSKFIDSRTGCIECGTPTGWRGINKGHSKYCNACGVKNSWKTEQAVERKEVLSKKLKETPMKGGRAKGIKNRNPYPRTAKVLQKFENNKGRPAPHNRDASKINKQKETWANKSEEEMRTIIKKRDETYFRNRGYISHDFFEDDDIVFNSLNRVFGINNG